MVADWGVRRGLLAQPLDVVPIPWAKRIEHVRENLAARCTAAHARTVAK